MPYPSRILLLTTALLCLAACGPLHIRDEAAGRYVAFRDGLFELHKDLTIPAGRTRVFLQGGTLVPSVNEFEPHCQFEVSTLMESPQTVHKDTFTVTRVGTRTDRVVQAAPVQLAALETSAVGLSFLFGWDETRQMHAYQFRLESERQPDVRSLICGGAFDDPFLARLPTLGEISRALGAYGTLKPGGDSGNGEVSRIPAPAASP